MVWVNATSMLRQSAVSHINHVLGTRGITPDLQRCMDRDARKKVLVQYLQAQRKLGKPLTEKPIKPDEAGVSENALIEAELKTFAKKNSIGFPPKLEAKMFMSVFNFIDTTPDADMREIGLRYLETILSNDLWNRSDFQSDIDALKRMVWESDIVTLKEMVIEWHGTDRQKYAAARIITAWHVNGDPREQDWHLEFILSHKNDQVVLGALNCLASISFNINEGINSKDMVEGLANSDEQKIRKAAREVLKSAKRYTKRYTGAFEESSGTEKTAAVPPYEPRRQESSQGTDGGSYRYVP